MTAAEIRMTLPADSRFVATARVTTASVAAELEFSVDEIEELRVGVNELVAVLVEWAEDNAAPEIDIVFRILDGALEIEGSVSASGAGSSGEMALDALTGQILASVVDEHEIAAGRGRIVKRRAAA